MSGSGENRVARGPRRERGVRRVAALLKAAAALFVEKGYDAVTMTEVASRAGAPIGSLYQFFPSKDALADGLLERFGAQLSEALEDIERQAAACNAAELAGSLLRVLSGFEVERSAVAVLIDSRKKTSRRAEELKQEFRRHVERILRTRLPMLSEREGEATALVVVQLIKAAARLSAEEDPAIRESVLAELSQLTTLYLDRKNHTRGRM